MSEKELPEHLKKYTAINSYNDLLSMIELLKSYLPEDEKNFLTYTCQSYYKNNFKNFSKNELLNLYEKSIFEKYKYLLNYRVIESLENRQILPIDFLKIYLKENELTSKQVIKYLPIAYKNEEYEQIKILCKDSPNPLKSLIEHIKEPQKPKYEFLSPQPHEEKALPILCSIYQELFPTKCLDNHHLFEEEQLSTFIKDNPLIVLNKISKKHNLRALPHILQNTIAEISLNFYLEEEFSYPQILKRVGYAFYEKTQHLDLDSILSKKIQIDLNDTLLKRDSEGDRVLSSNFDARFLFVNSLQEFFLKLENDDKQQTLKLGQIIKDKWNIFNQPIIEVINNIEYPCNIIDFAFKNDEYSNCLEFLTQSINLLDDNQHKIVSNYIIKQKTNIHKCNEGWLKDYIQDIPKEKISIYQQTTEFYKQKYKGTCPQNSFIELDKIFLEKQLEEKSNHLKKVKI